VQLTGDGLGGEGVGLAPCRVGCRLGHPRQCRARRPGRHLEPACGGDDDREVHQRGHVESVGHPELHQRERDVRGQEADDVPGAAVGEQQHAEPATDPSVWCAGPTRAAGGSRAVAQAETASTPAPTGQRSAPHDRCRATSRCSSAVVGDDPPSTGVVRTGRSSAGSGLGIAFSSTRSPAVLPRNGTGYTRAATGAASTSPISDAHQSSSATSRSGAPPIRPPSTGRGTVTSFAAGL
jgi:hypothetical protein